MITLDSTYVCDVPVTRHEMGFPTSGDRGNAILLLASEMQPETQAAYQRAGCIHEGVRIASCSEDVFAVLEQMNLRYCPWPNRGFALVILDHALLGMLADQLVVADLLRASHHERSNSPHEE